MRAAIVDLGAFTFHAVVADVDAHGIRRVLFDRKVATRLGQYEGTLPDTVFYRAVDAAEDLIERVQRRVSDEVRVLASGLFDELSNGRRLLAEVTARTGCPVERLDAPGEAALTWLGVSTELAGSHGLLATVDLGGSGLSVAAGVTRPQLTQRVPLGVLRLGALAPAAVRERILAEAGPSIAALREAGPDTVALTSGTAHALLGVARRLGLVAERQRYVSARTFVELARRLPVMARGALGELVSATRLDSVAAGAVALATVLELLGLPVVYVAEAALREGALVELARSRRAAVPPAVALAR